MLKQFESRNFKAETQAIIDKANEIIKEYRDEGFNLTLRQLYYQFVARGIIENTERSYKNLGKTISNARMAGLVDWSAIVDRTRNMKSNSHWSGIHEILDSCAYQYRRDLWAGQRNVVEVWIEKEALIGVIEKPCRELDVNYFACRGYVSQSEQWAAGERALERWYHHNQTTTIIHLGDHDPSGVDMTRDNLDRLNVFTDQLDIIEVVRIALNWSQIEEYDPPPNPTKLTDSRAKEYIKNYGRSCWELDALEPRVIDRLIRDEVRQYIDADLWTKQAQLQQQERERIQEIARRERDNG